MGIIQQQSIKGTVYTYIGVFLGLINTAFLFPLILNPDEIGLLSLIISYSVIFTQLSSMGFTYVTTRMFTYFRDSSKQHHGFFFLLIGVGIIGFILSVGIFELVKPLIIKDSIEKSALFVEHLYYIMPLVFFQLFFLLLDNYYKVLYNAVFGTFLKEFLIRFLVTITIALYFFKIVNFDLFLGLYLMAFAAPTLFIIGKLIIEKQISFNIDFSLLDKKMRSTIISVAFFGILLSFSGVIVLNIDRIMVNSYLGIGTTGIYTIAFFFGSIILIPNRSLQKISSVVIADAWKNNDLDEIKTIYKKSCINQFIIAVLLFIGIWGNIHNILKFLPPEYESGKYVIFFIGLSGVVNMASGVSASIIANSKFYKVQSLIMLIYIVALILSNYILIPVYGMTGAAIATLISSLIFVVLKIGFLYSNYKIQPYNNKYLLVSFLAILTYYSSLLIPEFQNYIIDIPIRSFCMFLIFSGLILALRISEEANSIFIKFVNSFIRK